MTAKNATASSEDDSILSSEHRENCLAKRGHEK
jgi:hypothetical protein